MSKYRNELGQPIGFPLKDWMPRPAPGLATMPGVFCRLEPLEPDSHASDLYQAFSSAPDDRDWTYLTTGPFADFASFRNWMTLVCRKDDPLFFAIVQKSSGRPLGVASFMRIQPTIGSIEVGHIHYSPQLQRTPAATEAMFLMMRRVFDELGYRRYEWKCDALNEGSRRAALRLGFSFEGIFRQATIYKGRNRDTAWYAIVDRQWPMLKQAFKQWLDPSNFSAEGHQIERLGKLITRLR